MQSISTRGPGPGSAAACVVVCAGTLWRLPGGEDGAGITLTESRAMHAAASVCGLYFPHPEARYFAVGKIGRDQVPDYAAREGIPHFEAERRLAPNLACDPAAANAGA